MGLIKILKRLLSGKKSRESFPDYVTIGKYSYGLTKNVIAGLSPDAPLVIGKYCSIGQDAWFFSKADHPLNLVSTYPLRTMIWNPMGPNKDAVTKGGINIGHDVWIGQGVYIKSGVKVGNGAVIGMGSVLTKDVGDYEIWAGNPAVKIGQRFNNDIINAMQVFAWWDLDDAQLTEVGPFITNPESLLKKKGLL